MILTTEEKARLKEQQIILTILCILTVVVFGLYKIVRHVEKEAFAKGVQFEHDRIVSLATTYHKDNVSAFIKLMERESRGR